MNAPQAAHLIRIMRSIAIELRISNDLTAHSAHRYSTAMLSEDIADRREQYREEMS